MSAYYCCCPWWFGIVTTKVVSTGIPTGDNTTSERRSPGRVSLLASVAAISTCDSVSCALLGNGSVACWGLNDWGHLGALSSLQHLFSCVGSLLTRGCSDCRRRDVCVKVAARPCRGINHRQSSVCCRATFVCPSVQRCSGVLGHERRSNR